MKQSKSLRSLINGVILSTGTASLLVGSVLAAELPGPPPLPPNEKQVYLVRQDFSNCTNDDVPNTDSANVTGVVTISRGQDGNTTLKIALTGTPDTTYHFFLKCVRQLGDVKTGDEGTGMATFTFPTGSAGNVYAFDSYPEGAPAGNKFQSAQVKF